jgi:glycosyltransferase involved in cell wall biosynthesis
LKIIYCLNHFLPSKQAGTEIYVWALAKEIQRKGHEAIILIPSPGEPSSREYEYDGLRVIQYAEPSAIDRAFMRSRKAPAGLNTFLSFVQQIAPSLVHIHEYTWSNGITVHHFEALRLLNIPTVMTMHLAGYTCRTSKLMYMGKDLCDGLIRVKRCARCSLNDSMESEAAAMVLYAASVTLYKLKIDPSKWDNRLGTALSFPFIIEGLREGLERLIGSVNQIIVLTKWYKKILEINGVPENKLTYIPQGLPQKAEKTGRGSSAADGAVRLVFVGRIDPLKGLHLLLEALAGLPADKINLDIYGQVADERYHQECMALSEKMNNVGWKGIMNQKEVIPTLGSYHALCLPSTFSEMSPLVIQEAFAAGIPVIGSDVYGIAEQVREGVNGLLFRFNDPGSLQNVLRRIIGDPSLLRKMSENVGDPLQFSEIAMETLNVYNRILENPVKKGEDIINC